MECSLLRSCQSYNPSLHLWQFKKKWNIFNFVNVNMFHNINIVLFINVNQSISRFN